MSTAGGHMFVGREREMAHLQRLLDAAAGGAGSLVMVVGEPGIGKTALCERLAAYVASHGGQVLTGHCYEEGSLSLPYMPFVEALRAHVLATEPDELRRELGDGAADVVRIVPELHGRLGVELRPAGDPEYDRYRLLESVKAFVRSIAARRPLLLILEDLHDADRGTLDLLIHLARHLGDASLLVAGTYRDVEVDRAHPLSGALAELRRAGRFGRVTLRGLSPNDVQRLMERLAGEEVPESLAGAVHGQTEGNPLFVQEVSRLLLDEGTVARQGGRGRMTTADALAGGIPEGLRDVIGKRLSRLSLECNRVLVVAAVAGREFDLETVRAVAGVEEETLDAALAEAERAAVLEEQARPGRVRYRFAHAFFRQTLYEELIAPRRLRLHQQVARALEAQHGRRLDEHAAELAEHFAQSTDPADLEKAVAYGERAAERAAAVYAYSEAVRLLEQAIAVQEVLDPDDDAKRCVLLLALGDALMPAGEPRRAADPVAEAAFALAESIGDSRRAMRACRMALDALIRSGHWSIWHMPSYGRWAQRASRYAEPGTSEQVHADIALADVHAGAGSFRETCALVYRAFELARTLDDPNTRFFAAVQILIYSGAPRRWNDRIRLAEEALTWRRDGVTPRNLGRILGFAADAYLEAGDREQFEELRRQVKELAVRTHDVDLVLYAARQESVAALLDGDLQAAVAVPSRLLDQAEAPEEHESGAHVAESMAFRPLLYLGRAEEALAIHLYNARLTGLDDDALLTSGGGSIGATYALILAYLHQHREARDTIRQVLERLDIGSAEDETPAWSLVRLLEAATLVGDQEAVILLASRLAPVASAVPVGLHGLTTCVARHLGAAAALVGDQSAALTYSRQALDVAERVRFRPEVSLTRLQLAELLHDGKAEERTQARAHLESASAEFEAMGMRPALERAQHLRARLGGQQSARLAAPHPDGLSDREVEVLRGIAMGRSNQEIAQALVVSVRTVERHAVNIYAKIGARGRTDAVAYAVRHGLADAPPP